MKVDVMNITTWKFPCLLRSENGAILMATGLKNDCTVIGTVIKPTNKKLGQYSEYWDRAQFSLFTGTVTLEN